MMDDFLTVYKERQKEIEDFFVLLKFLETKENSRHDGESEFDQFFHNGERQINLTYQALVNIMKSNASLMIYNIIEYTVTNLMYSIYYEIEKNKLSYFDVNECIRILWKKMMLKAASDPNASFNTFVKKNDEIIKAILDRHIIKLEVKNSLPAGNLDAKEIQKLFEKHGIGIDQNSINFRRSINIMDKIKLDRNNLGHGSMAFTEALRENTINELEDSYNYVKKFLDELIVFVGKFLKNKEYQQKSA